METRWDGLRLLNDNHKYFRFFECYLQPKSVQCLSGHLHFMFRGAIDLLGVQRPSLHEKKCRYYKKGSTLSGNSMRAGRILFLCRYSDRIEGKHNQSRCWHLSHDCWRRHPLQLSQCVQCAERAAQCQIFGGYSREEI